MPTILRFIEKPNCYSWGRLLVVAGGNKVIQGDHVINRMILDTGLHGISCNFNCVSRLTSLKTEKASIKIE
jgi:hypothetical protein